MKSNQLVNGIALESKRSVQGTHEDECTEIKRSKNASFLLVIVNNRKFIEIKMVFSDKRI